ncbi:hypothetical protein GCK32_002079 [Trichostrongylus colubriformis]|uniref:Uncharacterized protein n=1 Tax=Trichostrongylus colubriformis TaxID=6319 RepID=A0AAN8IFS9_TRICO
MLLLEEQEKLDHGQHVFYAVVQLGAKKEADNFMYRILSALILVHEYIYMCCLKFYKFVTFISRVFQFADLLVMLTFFEGRFERVLLSTHCVQVFDNGG